MKLFDPVGLFLRRRNNPLVMKRVPFAPLLYLGAALAGSAAMVLLPLYSPVEFGGEDESGFLVMLGIQAITAPLAFLLFSCLRIDTARLEELYLTRLSKKEIAFGLLYRPMWAGLIMTAVNVAAYTYLMVQNNRLRLDSDILLAAYSNVIAAGVISALAVARHSLDAPNRPIQVFLKTLVSIALTAVFTLLFYIGGFSLFILFDEFMNDEAAGNMVFTILPVVVVLIRLRHVTSMAEARLDEQVEPGTLAEAWWLAKDRLIRHADGFRKKWKESPVWSLKAAGFFIALHFGLGVILYLGSLIASIRARARDLSDMPAYYHEVSFPEPGQGITMTLDHIGQLAFWGVSGYLAILFLSPVLSFLAVHLARGRAKPLGRLGYSYPVAAVTMFALLSLVFYFVSEPVRLKEEEVVLYLAGTLPIIPGIVFSLMDRGKWKKWTGLWAACAIAVLMILPQTARFYSIQGPDADFFYPDRFFGAALMLAPLMLSGLFLLDRYDLVGQAAFRSMNDGEDAP